MRLEDHKPVAIKFINEKINKDQAKREYEMYTYLNAVNQTEPETYGIPTVYYYGRWNGCIVTAYTELEETLAHRIENGFHSDYDILLLMQQFVRWVDDRHSNSLFISNTTQLRIKSTYMSFALSLTDQTIEIHP